MDKEVRVSRCLDSPIELGMVMTVTDMFLTAIFDKDTFVMSPLSRVNEESFSLILKLKSLITTNMFQTRFPFCFQRDPSTSEFYF